MKKIELQATEIPAEEAEEMLTLDNAALIAAIDAFLAKPFTMAPAPSKD